MQKIQGKIRKVIEEYNMIEDGDKVAVGVSGGKDSLTLLSCLASLRKYFPRKFSLVAITVDMFNGATDYSKIQELCASLDVEYHIIPSQIYEILFEVRKEQNPCSLCTRMRRGILSETAIKLGCNKLALGHHADDLLETFFLSLFYESRLSTFLPVTHLDKTGITMIRPMLLVWEKETIEFAKSLPVVHNVCPADKNTQREYIKGMLKGIAPHIKKVHAHILSALMHPERNHLFPLD